MQSTESRYTLYPEGYQSTSPDSVFYGGVLVGVLYVTVVMYLRLLDSQSGASFFSPFERVWVAHLASQVWHLFADVCLVRLGHHMDELSEPLMQPVPCTSGFHCRCRGVKGMDYLKTQLGYLGYTYLQAPMNPQVNSIPLNPKPLSCQERQARRHHHAPLDSRMDHSQGVPGSCVQSWGS